MQRLKIQYAPSFSRDVKKLAKKHVNIKLLYDVVDLIAQNTQESRLQLRQRHNMHQLSGKWAGSLECHVCNMGDWLLIWCEFDDIVLLQRTGSHKNLFR